MTLHETNEAILNCVVGRKLSAYEINYKEGVLYLEFDSGVVFSVFRDDEDLTLCIAADRKLRH